MANSGDLFGDGSAARKLPEGGAAQPAKKKAQLAPVPQGTPGEAGYTAASIEVLEGLEPVRRRPGHVHRRHGRKGAAPPLRRGDRQLHGRGRGGPRHLHRGIARRGRLAHRHRQRPRHPDRPASKVPGQVGARGHHDHAARRRKVRQQGLRDVGRPARRGRVRRQRLVGPARGRGGARPAALPPALLARHSAGAGRASGRSAQPARHARALSSRPADLRGGGQVPAATPLQDGPLQGLSLRRRRDPLVLRALPPRGRHGARRGGIPLPPPAWKDYLAREIRGKGHGHRADLRRQGWRSPAATARSNGR